ncbi:MAG: WD40 repeat domain-containing protein [Saprospiraceae bacterium]|nr:WD40 repeat domain-containing protein [Saprospiraceae bacterium]
MRSTIFLLTLLFAGTLAAQNYRQNEAPVQQTQMVVDCYTRILDLGNAALQRGEAREALRFFNEAKKCPDAQGNSRRQTELDTRISRCEAQLGIKKVSADKSTTVSRPTPTYSKREYSNELPGTRRNYAANRGFLKDTLDDCFSRMVEEANRAYNLRFWEDAAALYRAAKNCADADQSDRQRMSNRIHDCRNAAENELFAKQQEAERQARHAIAANLADDAEELLKNTDRSLAFRLADFANQYVAPEDNADCVQAMFDAWYYQSSEDSKHREDELFNPVFCYELAENLGENTQVKFQALDDGRQLLWAFVPKNGDMLAWEIPSMKIVQSYGTGEGNGYTGFDFSPDGELLFWGSKFFDLRRGTRSFRIDVPSIAQWCFSTRGDEFFYEDRTEQKIYILNVREAFEQQNARKSSKGANALQLAAVPREIVSGIPEGLLAMQYLDGKFWLGFRDRIEVLSKAEAGKQWRREKTILFEGVDIPDYVQQRDLRLQIFPEKGLAVLGNNGYSWSIRFENHENTVQSWAFKSLRTMAVSASAGRVACEYTGHSQHNGFWLMDAATGDTLLRQKVPLYTDYELMKGCFSPDGRWVAATSFGNVNVWALQDDATVWDRQLPRPPDGKPVFSPNGSLLFATFADSIHIFSTNDSDKPKHVWKCGGQPLRGASDQWVLIQTSPDSAEARHLTTGRRLRFPLKSEAYSPLYAFDSKGEKLVAYLSNSNKVEVRALKSGEIVGSKVFDGGMIGELHFIPGTDKLLVVQHNSMGESEIGQSSVKLWSPFSQGEKSRALRLHEYPVLAMAVDGAGNLAAFSNGSDIRVFDLKNIENEVLKIRAAPDEYVQAIAFQPNSNLLAAAYSTGKVVFWNFQTGQLSFKLQVIPSKALEANYKEIASIGFSNAGTVLQIVVNDGRMLAYALDPSYIRAVAQDENRQLQAFSVEHIVLYNLEAALYYPGNFERLAESGDAPLVRSFFRHFRGQAVESNNITQVRNYCERAFYLYERLDGNTQELWRPEMRLMYEDYTRKLLLRGNIKEAAAMIDLIKREFNYEPVLLNAHLALLQRNLSKASSLYTEYLLSSEDGIPLPADRRWFFDGAENELKLLRDYELIDSAQANCICSTVSLSNAFYDFCAGTSTSSLFLSQADRLRWEIFQKRDGAANTVRNAAKVKFMEEARQKARELYRKDPSAGQVWLETVTLELAESYKKWGLFEQNSPEALPHFEKSVQLLSEIGAFKKHSDTSRLSLLTSTQLAWGKFLLASGNNREAYAHFNLGLESAQPLSEAVYESDTSLLRIYKDNLFGPLYKGMGDALLLEGLTNEARQVLEQANLFYVTYGLNSLYLSNVAVLENDEVQAFLDYSGITNASHTGEALFWIDRLAEQFPEKREQIESFAPRLLSALRSKNQRLVNAEADYWLAKLKVEHFAAQSRWDSVIQWSTVAMQSAKRCSEQPNADEAWTTLWLDEHINLPYFLLLGGWGKPSLLADCIRYVELAEDFLAKQDSSYFYYSHRELLKTNLAHALVLRNKPGDRERAIELYKKFMQSYGDSRGYDNLDMLQKDFRDLKRAGAPWPALPELEETMNDER